MEIHFSLKGAVISFDFGLWVTAFELVWLCWFLFCSEACSLWKIQSRCADFHSPVWPSSVFCAVCVAAAEQNRKELENHVLQINSSFVTFTPAHARAVWGPGLLSTQFTTSSRAGSWGIDKLLFKSPKSACSAISFWLNRLYKDAKKRGFRQREQWAGGWYLYSG